jgi:hypothetical protein
VWRETAGSRPEKVCCKGQRKGEKGRFCSSDHTELDNSRRSLLNASEEARRAKVILLLWTPERGRADDVFAHFQERESLRWPIKKLI